MSNNTILDQIAVVSAQITGTYNRAKYLKSCINSVINQTFKDWQLNVVQDGSQDNAFEIVNTLYSKV